jgi:predicted MFS family arabinose efflux permease
MVAIEIDQEVAKGEWASGWRVVFAAALANGTSWMFFQNTAGLFIIPMQAEFGWSRSAVAIGPLGGLISIVFYPAAGALIDRFGPRRMALIGLTMLSIGFVMLATVPAKPLIFYAVVLYLSIAGAISNAIVFGKCVATWFTRRIGTAIGIMQTGVTVATVIGFPFLSAVIARHSWRAGFLAIAGIVAFGGIPMCILWFRARPHLPYLHDDTTMAAGFSFHDAIRDPRFTLMVAAFGVAALPIGGFLSQLQPLLIGSGIAQAVAAALGSVFVFSVGAGRVIVGMLFDRTRPGLVAAGSLAISALGALLLVPVATGGHLGVVAIAAVAMIGVAQGAESDYLSFFTARIFGLRSFSRLVGVLSMVVGGGMAIGGFIFSAVYDHFRDYTTAVLGCLAMYFIAALLFMTIKVPPAGTVKL